LVVVQPRQRLSWLRLPLSIITITYVIGKHTTCIGFIFDCSEIIYRCRYKTTSYPLIYKINIAFRFYCWYWIWIELYCCLNRVFYYYYHYFRFWSKIMCFVVFVNILARRSSAPTMIFACVFCYGKSYKDDILFDTFSIFQVIFLRCLQEKLPTIF